MVSVDFSVLVSEGFSLRSAQHTAYMIPNTMYLGTKCKKVIPRQKIIRLKQKLENAVFPLLGEEKMTILNLELKQNWKFSIHGGFVFVCLLVLHEIVILIHALRLNSILLLAVCNKTNTCKNQIMLSFVKNHLLSTSYIEWGTNERLSICAENEIFGQQPRELGSEQNKLRTKQ